MLFKNNTLYSIGHGHKTVEEFIDELQSFSIQFLVDVRTSPYSKWAPHFNRGIIEHWLSQAGIKYGYMGDIIGGKPQNDSCYDDEGYFGGTYPEGSMIVMCDFTEKQLDRLLMDFRNRNVKIDYKMVMTATNASWDVLHVYFEAQKEKMMYEMAQRDRKKFPFR